MVDKRMSMLYTLTTGLDMDSLWTRLEPGCGHARQGKEENQKNQASLLFSLPLAAFSLLLIDAFSIGRAQMKNLTKLGLATVLVLGVAGMAGAHSPAGELYFAAQFPDSIVPTMDGDLSDWDIVPIDPYTILNDRLYSPVADIQPVGRGEIDVSDINIRHLLGWNENYNKLYFMSEVYDNVHNADRENPSAFWQDDAWEVEVNVDHTPTEEHNMSGEPVNNFSYKWAVPPVEGSYQYYRPQASLTWLLDGTEWVDFGWDFTGEKFGESTYYYELAITPILSMPNDDASEQEGHK